MLIYTIETQYNKDNIKDFLLKNDTRHWFLSENHAKKYVQEYSKKIPFTIFNAIEKEGWTIEITNKDIQKLYNIRYEIYGITIEDEKKIYVCSHELAIQYALAHEIGHFLDRYLEHISWTFRWKEIHSLHKKDVSVPEYYFTDESNNDEEYFAECFLLFINDPILLKKINVSAYYLFEKIMNNIDAIVELI